MGAKFAVCLGVVLAGLSAGLALAEDVTALDIVNALDPATAKKPASRSWNRGVTVQQPAQAEGPPSIDLYVNFEFDSADLTADSQITLDVLGKALTDPRLAGFAFMIAGHTDAKGTDDYNQSLSERRAATVRTYLVRHYGLDPAKVQEKGYGESQLLDPARPEDGINRRVQIVNLSVPVAGQ